MSSQSSSSSSALISNGVSLAWFVRDRVSVEESSSVSSPPNITRASSCSFIDGFVIDAGFFGAARLEFTFWVLVRVAGRLGGRIGDGGSDSEEEADENWAASSSDGFRGDFCLRASCIDDFRLERRVVMALFVPFCEGGACSSSSSSSLFLLGMSSRAGRCLHKLFG